MPVCSSASASAGEIVEHSAIRRSKAYVDGVRWLLCFVVLVAGAGCGASEQQRVAATMRAYDAAWDRGDLDGACSWLTKSGLTVTTDPLRRALTPASPWQPPNP